jgi:hypothetical protein
MRHRGWLGSGAFRAHDGAMNTPIFGRRRHDRRRAFIERFEFPVALEIKLRDSFDSDREVQVALEGLREWYLACLDAPGESLGMPSRAVDIAWHEMILMTRTYHAFCERAFGFYLHHSPEALMDEPLQYSLARTLAVLESRPDVGAVAGVPLLFAIDGELRPEEGFVWEEDDIGRLRTLQAHRWADYSPAVPGHGHGCGADGGGGGCGGGGCGGGG